MKTQINEVINLMSRMNLFEGSSKPRQQVSRDEIIDILDRQDNEGAGLFVSLFYVTTQDFYVTRKNWRQEEMTSALGNYEKEGNESWYDSIKGFNDDPNQKKVTGIDGMITVTNYKNLHWTSPKSFGKATGDYNDKLHNLRWSYGVALDSGGMLGDNHNQRSDLNGGQVQQNQTGRLSHDFNMAGRKPEDTIRTTYVVGADGHIKGEIAQDIVKLLYAPKKRGGVEKAVQDALADNPEALEEYKQKLAEIQKEYRAQNFLFDGILAIVASIPGANGVTYYFINDKVQKAIKKNSDINVDSGDLVHIIREKLSETIDDVQNYTPMV